ncbi:alkane 1-monooxygenase [Gymnodinialimonas hymeniacidonis]|uniref:alkane 1-monooxygenase n=1 Tax=Gymnodinialimonas hymeniacidonis TaxID=3126508 RepID=UPI0034C5C737
MPVIARYAAITLPPMFLLLLAATAWGGFAWIALAWLTIVAAVADRLLEPPKTPAPEEETLPWSDTLSFGLGVGHLLVLIATCTALGSASLTFGQSIALFLATASFFGQVSHPNAHELIHRRIPIFKALGAAVYTSVGFGHHVSAHRLVHHRHVGTEQDPNTPLPGESFWAYLPRAWRGSFETGIVQEIERLDRKGHGPNHISNPYWLWLGGALLTVIAVLTGAGLGGLLVLIGLGALTGAQILMSDYVQHYGLQRLILPNGRIEPVAAHHSWNAPKGFSSYLMMNAPAHSEHHMHPDQPYERLDTEAQVPTLPFSMPIMAMIATVPTAWHRMMDKRALKVMEAAQAAHLAPKPAAQSAPEPTQAPVTANPQDAAPNSPVVPKQEAPEAAPLSDDPETDAMLQAIRAATR